MLRLILKPLQHECLQRGFLLSHAVARRLVEANADLASEFTCVLTPFWCGFFSYRCWRSICRIIPRCTAERRATSPETGSTRTCCSTPACSTCTSPPRKRSDALMLPLIDSSVFLKKIHLSTFDPSNSSCVAPHRRSGARLPTPSV